MPAIDKILIANRGEIASRIARTCHDMGIATVAVFSDADRHAPHVAACDEAIHIGPAESRSSYLDIERIIAAARITGADAIHPGYGFLAENAALPRACSEAGLVFIGPSAEVIEALGSKEHARRLAEKAGVPVVPSYPADPAAAAEMAYPVLIKASAGGGGKGMRIVRAPEALADALEAARREAKSSFGDDTLLVERYLDRSRHVEIQIFGDHHGNLVHLFERECSIQRRHQKIVEETPSTAVDGDLRQTMGQAAVRLAQEVGYQNAGTVEFLLAEDKSFYFLEVNTRLQVEHPVTEMVTGLDLVREQIRVARGEPLSFRQESLTQRGHAIEVRLYAEDPDRDLLPATGTILAWAADQSAHVRVDTGVETGSEVGIHYDPMLAKLAAWGQDRTEAIARLARALERLVVLGVVTNRHLLASILRHPQFAAGATDTHFLQRHSELLADPASTEDVVQAARLVTALGYAERSAARSLDVTPGWSNNPLPEPDVGYRRGDEEVRIAYRPLAADRLTFTGDGGDQTWTVQAMSSGVRIEPEAGALRDYPVVRRGSTWYVALGSRDIELAELARFPDHASAADEGSLTAPMPGRVVKVLVEVGAACTAGQTLIIMEAMKMEHSVVAGSDGTVRDVMVSEGDPVEAGATLLAIDPAE